MLVQNTYLYQILQLTSYTVFFYRFTQYSVFSFALLFFALITLLTLLIRGGRRLKFSEIEKAMAGKKGKKKDK